MFNSLALGVLVSKCEPESLPIGLGRDSSSELLCHRSKTTWAESPEPGVVVCAFNPNSGKMEMEDLRDLLANQSSL